MVMVMHLGLASHPNLVKPPNLRVGSHHTLWELEGIPQFLPGNLREKCGWEHLVFLPTVEEAVCCAAYGDLMAAGDASAGDPGASRSPLLREENTHHMGPPPRMMPFSSTATLAAGWCWMYMPWLGIPEYLPHFHFCLGVKSHMCWALKKRHF